MGASLVAPGGKSEACVVDSCAVVMIASEAYLIANGPSHSAATASKAIIGVRG